MTLKAVVLPAPFGPIRPETMPSRDVERDPVERDDAAEPKRDVADGEQHLAAGSYAPLPVEPRRRSLAVATRG